MSEENKGSATTEDSAAEPNSRRKFLKGGLAAAAGVAAGTIGAPAAILNAAIDALRPLGVRDLHMPLTSEKLWRAINGAPQRNES